ncbi:MAG: hypothetical protein D6772_07775, partial [Bacteroidetes bacterium]
DNGCRAVDSLVIRQIDDLPVVEPIADTTLTCSRSSLTLNGALPTDGANYEARWCPLDQDGFEITNRCDFGLSYEVGQPGIYSFTVTNLATNCSASERVQVSLDTLPPTVEAGRADTLSCNLSSLTLAGTAPPTSRLQWRSVDGLPITDAMTLTPSVTQAGWYILEATDRDNGCVGRDSVQIFADDRRPALEPLRDTMLTCAQPSVQLTASGNTLSSRADWQWRGLEGQLIDEPTNPTVTIDEAGTYVLTLTDPLNDCTVMDTLRVRRDIRRPTAVIDSLNMLELNCRTDTLTLSALASRSATGAALSYLWTIQGSGNLFPDAQAAVVQSDQSGLYRLVVTDTGNGCRDSLPFQLREDFAPPIFTLENNTPPLDCQRDSALLSVRTVRPVTELDFSWRSPDEEEISSTNTAVARQAGLYYLTVTNRDNGCSQTDSIRVERSADFPNVHILLPATLSCQQKQVLLDGSASQ